MPPFSACSTDSTRSPLWAASRRSETSIATDQPLKRSRTTVPKRA
jgi:hypothetical protein